MGDNDWVLPGVILVLRWVVLIGSFVVGPLSPGVMADVGRKGCVWFDLVLPKFVWFREEANCG